MGKSDMMGRPPPVKNVNQQKDGQIRSATRIHLKGTADLFLPKHVGINQYFQYEQPTWDYRQNWHFMQLFGNIAGFDVP
jgi:hypothetical protein